MNPNPNIQTGSRILSLTQANTIAFFLFVSIAAYCIAPDSQSHNFLVYLLALVVVCSPLAWRHCSILIREPIAAWLLLLLMYLALSVFWSSNSTKEEVLSSFGSLVLLFGFIVSVVVVSRSSTSVLFLFKVMVLITSGAAVVAILLHWMTSDLDEFLMTRLSGWGRLQNPVVAGTVYGAAAQIALVLAVTNKEVVNSATYALAAALLLWAVAMTQSRGPLFSALLVGTMSLVVYVASIVASYRFSPGSMIIAQVALVLGLAMGAWLTMMGYSKASRADHPDLAGGESGFNHPFDLASPNVRAGYRNTKGAVVEIEDGGVLRVAHGQKDVVGAILRSFEVDRDAKYFITFRARASASVAGGFYLIAQESDELRRREFVTDRIADRSVILVSDSSLDSAWQEFVVEYFPSSTSRQVSFLLLNSYRMGRAVLFVDELDINKEERSFLDMIRFSNFAVGHPNRTGLLQRLGIWRSVLSNPSWRTIAFGNGIATNRGIVAGGVKYEHPHSIYVSTYYYGGIVGLSLFVGSLLTIGLRLRAMALNQVSFVGAAMLSYALLVFSVDGDRLLAKIDHVWIVLWLPIGVLLRERVGDSSGMGS